MAALQLVSSFELQNSVTCPEKKLEKAIDLAYTTLTHVQLCCSDYVVSTLHTRPLLMIFLFLVTAMLHSDAAGGLRTRGGVTKILTTKMASSCMC